MQMNLYIIRTNVLYADMIPTNRFSTTLESLADLAPEILAAQVDPKSVLPNLSNVLAEFSPLPSGALFLGLASDGLPVLLNLSDPIPGPILIVGDPGSGKTSLMRNIDRAITRTYQPEVVRTIILTDHLEEWTNLGSPNCQGSFAINDSQTAGIIASLSTSAHQNRSEHQFTLLLIDDFESLLKHLNSNQDLRWLLLRGPARRVWPIATINSKKVVDITPLLGAFRTRLFGHIDDDTEASAIAGIEGTSFKTLVPGSQFIMREGNAWLQFWIPNLD